MLWRQGFLDHWLIRVWVLRVTAQDSPKTPITEICFWIFSSVSNIFHFFFPWGKNRKRIISLGCSSCHVYASLLDGDWTQVTEPAEFRAEFLNSYGTEKHSLLPATAKKSMPSLLWDCVENLCWSGIFSSCRLHASWHKHKGLMQKAQVPKLNLNKVVSNEVYIL